MHAVEKNFQKKKSKKVQKIFQKKIQNYKIIKL